MQNEYWWHEPAGLAWPGFLKSFPVDVVRHYIRLVRRRWPADEWQTILFALEAEHRTVPITNETRLDCSLERIRSAGYDFSGARAIGEALRVAAEERDRTYFQEMARRRANSPEAIFVREITVKNLPRGHAENIAIIRRTLGIRAASQPRQP
ncbi:MAG TPA: hypothetical protein VF450_13095 [Noviherbaspirillum sp.]